MAILLSNNFQVHWAHSERDNNWHSPAEVLVGVRRRVEDNATLYAAFTRHALCVTSTAVGSFSTIAFNDQPLVHDMVTYEADQQTFKMVSAPQFVATAFCSPRPPLWELTDDEWHKSMRPIRIARPLVVWYG